MKIQSQLHFGSTYKIDLNKNPQITQAQLETDLQQITQNYRVSAELSTQQDVYTHKKFFQGKSETLGTPSPQINDATINIRGGQEPLADRAFEFKLSDLGVGFIKYGK